MKSYGDRLTVEDISSPFEAFGMTQEYKQGLVDKYNDAITGSTSTSSNSGTQGSFGGSPDSGIRDVDASKYAPGTFSYNTNLDLPTYKVNSNFTAPTFTSPDVEKSLGEAPTYQVGSYEAPAYEAPKYNERKVQALTQQQAAPAIRGLRSAIQRVQNSGGENQNVNRMTLRDALAGYGQGLQSAMSGASATARGLYNEEYGRKADVAKTNFEARADASKTNYLAGVDAAKKNFEAQYDKYKMKWSELSDAAKMNYTSKYNEAMQNYQAKLDEGKLNYQNLVDAKKLAYQGGLDVAKTNYATNANWKSQQYAVENTKNMQEYDTAFKKWQTETTKQNKAPGVVFAPSYSSEEWHQPMQPRTYDTSYLNDPVWGLNTSKNSSKNK